MAGCCLARSVTVAAIVRRIVSFSGDIDAVRFAAGLQRFHAVRLADSAVRCLQEERPQRCATRSHPVAVITTSDSRDSARDAAAEVHSVRATAEDVVQLRRCPLALYTSTTSVAITFRTSWGERRPSCGVHTKQKRVARRIFRQRRRRRRSSTTVDHYSPLPFRGFRAGVLHRLDINHPGRHSSTTIAELGCDLRRPREGFSTDTDTLSTEAACSHRNADALLITGPSEALRCILLYRRFYKFCLINSANV